MTDFFAWHGMTLNQHVALRNEWTAKGYRFLSLSIYGSVAASVYAAVVIKRSSIVAQRDWPLLTATQWQQTFDEQAKQGYGPVILAATGPASDPRFAAVFEPQNPIPLTRHGLTSGDIGNAGTIQGMNATAKKQGLIPRWMASYGTAGDPRFAAIWVSNPANTLWNNDGLLDDAGNYQARFNAETSAWIRPSFVTLDGDGHYMSLFVADEIGPWQARHDMRPEEYQTEFNDWKAKGYFPICVQAGGGSAASARFAALFVQSEKTVARQFSATGPVANSKIDAVVRQTMQAYPVVRHASLAIVNGKKLVYARGYTLAEPSWPVVQPTSRFRMASVSKTVTALAVFKFVEAGKLALTDTLQGILKLRTPSGGAPVAAKFGSITIRHLLEHTSGLDTDAFSDGAAVVAAFKAAGHPAKLPVTRQMTDSYIASLSMVSSPGDVQAYSNCGYYLLGRVVGHLAGKDAPIDAYQGLLLGPLGNTRIRASADLVSAQPSDEARYQAVTISDPRSPDLTVDNSVMTAGQPLVPAGYGDDELSITQGAGGLSGATTDIARLIAIMIDGNDNPALKRATIVGMLRGGAALTAAGKGRAGYGLDSATDQGGGSFYGQKGGLLINSASVLQFNGQWGFALCWGSPVQVPNVTPGWYPDYNAVMSIAKSVSWGGSDLFPEFGMPSL